MQYYVTATASVEANSQEEAEEKVRQNLEFYLGSFEVEEAPHD